MESALEGCDMAVVHRIRHQQCPGVAGVFAAEVTAVLSAVQW